MKQASIPHGIPHGRTANKRGASVLVKQRSLDIMKHDEVCWVGKIKEVGEV